MRPLPAALAELLTGPGHNLNLPLKFGVYLSLQALK